MTHYNDPAVLAKVSEDLGEVSPVTAGGGEASPHRVSVDVDCLPSDSFFGVPHPPYTACIYHCQDCLTISVPLFSFSQPMVGIDCRTSNFHSYAARSE